MIFRHRHLTRASLGIVLAVVALCSSVTSHAAPAKAPELSFIFQKNNALPITVFNITFRVGSADDPVGFEGLAALTGALLREGGVKTLSALSKGGPVTLPARNRADIEEFLFPYAADINVNVSREQTTFRVTSTAADSEAVFNLLSQMILAPAFEPAEFERLRSMFLDEVDKRAPREDEEELGKMALEQRMYGKNHPYGHLVAGSVTGLRAMDLARIKGFYEQNFVRSRLTIGVAGVVSPLLEAKVRTAFTSLQPGVEARALIPEAPRQKQMRLLVVKGPFEAVGAHLGEPISLNRSHPRFPEMYLASMAFGKHRTMVGRLMKVVREIRGLNYGTYAYIEEFPHGGHYLTAQTQVARSRQAFTVWGRPTTLDNGCFLMRQIYREAKSFADKGLSPAEFKMAQNHLVGAVPLLATGLERRLGYAIDSHFYGIKGDYLHWLQNGIRAAKRERVNNLVQTVLDPGVFDLVVVTPDPDRFKKEILSASCPIKYSEGVEKPKDVLDEDKEISHFVLPLTEEQITIVDAESLVQ